MTDGNIIAEYTIGDDNNMMETMALSPDGKWLAVITEWELQLIDTKTWQIIIAIEEPTPIPAVLLFNADSTLLIVGCNDGSIQFWRVPDGEISFQVNHPFSIETLALSPDGETLATGSKEGTVCLWKVSR